MRICHCVPLQFPSDPQSGIGSVRVGLGRSERDTALLLWTDVATASGYTEVNVSVDIPDGVQTWVKVRATNNGTQLFSSQDFLS